MVELHPFAIGPTETKTTLYESRADDSSSLLPISDLQSRIYKGTEGVGKRDVDVKPLDCVLIKQDISSPALLKIDVQGYELQVLKGCRSLISYFDYIYVECSFMELYLGQPLANDVIAFLIDCDFCLSGVYNLDYDKRGLPVQADFLFISKES